MKQVVWMAVLSVVFMVGAFASALVHDTEFVIASGSAAIASAILATRAK